MKRGCWASQSPSRDASLSPLILGGNLWSSAEWVHALWIILCSSSIVSLYRAAMVEAPGEHEPTGWTFPWFEYLGQQQQQVGVLVASSTGEDVFGKSVPAHFTQWGNRTITVGAQTKETFDMKRYHDKVSTYRDLKEWLSFWTAIKDFKICSTFPASLISRALFPPTVPISPPVFPACSLGQSLSGGL